MLTLFFNHSILYILYHKGALISMLTLFFNHSILYILYHKGALISMLALFLITLFTIYIKIPIKIHCVTASFKIQIENEFTF